MKKIRFNMKESLSDESEEQNESDEDSKEEDHEDNKKMLHKLNSMIEADSKKLDNGGNIYGDVFNGTDVAASNKSKNISTKTEDEKLKSTKGVSTNKQLDPMNTSTTENDTTQVIKKSNYSAEGAPEEYFDEPPVLKDDVDDDSKEFNGEHNALKGSTAMLKNESSLFVAVLTFIIIGQFIN